MRRLFSCCRAVTRTAAGKLASSTRGYSRTAGQYEEALRVLEGVYEPRAQTERMLALAGAGRVPEALALSDSLIFHGDSTKRWDSVLVIMAQENPVAASGLVDRVQRLPKRTPELQARTFLDDGLRLSSIDTARAARRFREALTVGGKGESAGRAGLALIKLRLAALNNPADLPSIIDSLKSSPCGTKQGRRSRSIRRQRRRSRFHGQNGDTHESTGRSPAISGCGVHPGNPRGTRDSRVPLPPNSRAMAIFWLMLPKPSWRPTVESAMVR